MTTTPALPTPPAPLDGPAAHAPPHLHAAHAASVRVGLAYGFAAYIAWGLFPIYFRAIATAGRAAGITVDSFEILAQRVLWSLLVVLALIHWRKQWRELRGTFARPAALGLLALTAALIASNWLIYIYAVTSNQILFSSLGYYLNPLVNIALGTLLLGEKLRRVQWAAVGLAAAGLAWYVAQVGSLPWITITLAVTFAFYGLLRKRASAGPLIGLTVETALLAPLALGYIAFALITGARPLAFASAGPTVTTLLIASGLLTALPLLWFANAARRLRYSTIGFLQYIAPTGQFLLALAYGEKLDTGKLILVLAIWAGIALFVTDSLLHQRRTARRPQQTPQA